MQESIFNFVNFPQKIITIAQKEMCKVKKLGGIKLINMQIKSETSKAKWLIEIETNPILKLHLDIFESLIGTQKGNIAGRDLIFVQNSYIQKHLETESKFYKEALRAVTRLEIKKGIQNVKKWDEEHVFYNPLFYRNDGKTFALTKYFTKKRIYTLGQLLEKKAEESKK